MAPAHRPKLGQHFLASEGFRRRIAAALPLREDDLVIEIGPGRGAMTGLLAERASRVVAVELDAALASKLREKHKAEEHVEIIVADILQTDIAVLCRKHKAGSCYVFGNLPYYITSPIIHQLLNYVDVIRGAAVLVQREVAERITAQPGSREYGFLSVLVQLHSEPCIVMNVPPGAFSPPPKVHSTLVEFAMRGKFPHWTGQERNGFLEFARLCFAQKRKNLVNNLGGKYGKTSVREALINSRVASSARAEELTVEQLAGLHRLLLE